MGTMWMPTFPEMTGDTRRMNSNHGVAMVADALYKGLDVDARRGFEYCRRGIEEKTLVPWSGAPAGRLDQFYKEHGYFPALGVGQKEDVPNVNGFEQRQPIAVTLGTAYDEWCLSRIAEYLGKKSDAAMAEALENFIGTRPYNWLVTDTMPTLGEARGRLVLLRRWEGGDGLPFLWEDQKGADDVSQNAAVTDEGAYRLWVQDRFEYGADDKWAAFTAGLNAPREAGDVLLSFLSTKGTGTYGHPYRFAKRLNAQLLESDSAALRGWIAVDFGTPKLAEHIYSTNFK
jgi:hypothetical protein